MKLHIIGVALSMIITLGVIWAHPMETTADHVSFWKFMSLWVLVIATATAAL